MLLETGILPMTEPITELILKDFRSKAAELADRVSEITLPTLVF